MLGEALEFDPWATKDPIPLPDGQYKALRYGYAIEIDGKVFETRQGVRCTREHCGAPYRVEVSGGKATVLDS